jgi:IS30 family transposase
MTKHYTHLTQEERYQIHAYKKAAFSPEAIAAELNRHVSTINRELTRNTGLKGYRPKQAHQLAQARLLTKLKSVKLTDNLKQQIVDEIRQDWSPEQIQGRWLLEGRPVTVCPATIYQFIYADPELHQRLKPHLRHKKGYKVRTGQSEKRGQIKNRVSIDDRPEVVDLKERLGDWEADTVIGKGHQGVLVTLTERVSKLELIAVVPSKHSDGVTKAIIELLIPYRSTLQTITFDNGKEFAFHEQISKALTVEAYFAHPYHSWERGLNENHNGLIRQYLPKGMPLDKVTQEEANDIARRMNQRPRKLLGFKTPEEVYTEMAKAA